MYVYIYIHVFIFHSDAVKSMTLRFRTCSRPEIGTLHIEINTIYIYIYIYIYVYVIIIIVVAIIIIIIVILIVVILVQSTTNPLRDMSATTLYYDFAFDSASLPFKYKFT